MSRPGSTFARKWATSLISITVLLLCIRYIFVRFQWSKIIRILQSADLVWLLVGGTSSILIYWFLRACRWSVILGNLGINIDFGTLYLCSAVSLSMAIVTPAQSGEMLKVELLKKRGLMERFPGYGSFIFERYIDSCAIVMLAIFGLSGRMTFVRKEILTLFLGLIMAGLLTAIVVVLGVRFGGRLGEMQNWLRACVKNAIGLCLILS